MRIQAGPDELLLATAQPVFENVGVHCCRSATRKAEPGSARHPHLVSTGSHRRRVGNKHGDHWKVEGRPARARSVLVFENEVGLMVRTV